MGKEHKVVASCAHGVQPEAFVVGTPGTMDGPVQKRDAVSRNIQRSLAMQTQQSKLTHPVNKALHHTCVSFSGLGLRFLAEPL